MHPVTEKNIPQYYKFFISLTFTFCPVRLNNAVVIFLYIFYLSFGAPVPMKPAIQKYPKGLCFIWRNCRSFHFISNILRICPGNKFNNQYFIELQVADSTLFCSGIGDKFSSSLRLFHCKRIDYMS